MGSIPVRRLLVTVSLLMPTSGVCAQYDVYQSLSDWQYLPHAKIGVEAGMASSYDRAGFNEDFNNYEWPEGHLTEDTDPVTIKTITGSGVLTRFWMPHAAANEAFTVKITIDGNVLIDTDSDTLLGGNYNATDPNLFKGSLVQTLLGGQVCYEPIPFQNSLVIESTNYKYGSWARTHHYYQYNFVRLTGGQSITSYNGTLTAQEQTARNAATEMITTNLGKNPSTYSSDINTSAVSIQAGQAYTLASLGGTGHVTQLNLKMDGASDASLDGLRLRVRYDGQPENAIDVPVSQFFGAGHNRVPYQSLAMGTVSQNSGGEQTGFYSYWPMPYRKGVVVELYNETGIAMSIDSAHVGYEQGNVSPEEGNLHAVYRETTFTGPTEGYHYMLDGISGRGHYVGNLLYVKRMGADSFNHVVLESDETITVDGQVTLQGTGLEDAYNSGYFYNHVVVQDDDGDVPEPYSGIMPYHGLLQLTWPGMENYPGFLTAEQYRWLIGDNVPFTEDLEVKIENHIHFPDMLNFPDCETEFSSVAFYYLIPEKGDADLDRIIDDSDLNVLLSLFGTETEASWVDGDFDGDGDVDDCDLNLLLTNFGYGVSSTPEPTAMAFLIPGMICLIRRRYNRCKIR